MKVGRSRFPASAKSRTAGAKEDVPYGISRQRIFDKEGWTPISELGKKVKSGEIKTLDEILDKGIRIMEAEIVDCLVANLPSDLLMIGQSKGKFGGGKRTIWRQTQRKTMEGNKPSFAAMSVVGNRDGFLGLGMGKSKETVPAREKAVRNSKLNMIKVRRGCGSWECNCKEPHSIPVKATGKVGSVAVTLMPAPKGTGIVAEKEIAKLINLAGIKDIYSASAGHTATKLNLIKACFEALKNLGKVKLKESDYKNLGVREGSIEA